MKIAPTLQSWTFDDGKWSDKMGAGDAQTQAGKELRALLAVARAARPFGEGPESPAGLKLHRALARLEKVSMGRAGKGEP